jgi:prepilin-type N-terminal cleavage/methylation domain-containing protein
MEAGVTLLELLCVMVIIGILASMLLPTVARAYNRIRGEAEVLEAPDVADMLREGARRYCKANSQFQFTGKTDFADKCGLAPRCRDWVLAPSTEFIPFTYQDPTNKTVLSVYLGPKKKTLYAFTIGNLSVTPER